MQNNSKYDFLIVGCGLFGSTVAERLLKLGYKVLIIDKSNHIGGNIYTENIEGINVHKYGAHIFHTSNKMVWDYVNSFCEFVPFVNSPIANYKGELYNLPFNMNTFVKIFPGTTSIDDVKNRIEKEIKAANITSINNLEDQAISLVGTSIYQKLIKGYTEKQWGRGAKDLPASIIKRIPLRFTFDNNYFNDVYQGIPKDGYTEFVKEQIKGCDVILNANFFDKKDYYSSLADKIIYTGSIDEYFEYKYGKLEYRSVKFDNKIIDKNIYQGVPVMNFTDRETPYTRVIEHKLFDHFCSSSKTIISFEYPLESGVDNDPYYPINNDRNNELYKKYFEETKNLKNIYFGGRLASYKYFDMDDIIEEAFKLVDKIKFDL